MRRLMVIQPRQREYREQIKVTGLYRLRLAQRVMTWVETLHDTSKKGNGNEGHEFGTTLHDEETNSLIEDLKTS